MQAGKYLQVGTTQVVDYDYKPGTTLGVGQQGGMILL